MLKHTHTHANIKAEYKNTTAVCSNNSNNPHCHNINIKNIFSLPLMFDGSTPDMASSHTLWAKIGADVNKQ